MQDDLERLVAEIDPHLKARAKADPRPIREIVESALAREFMTGDTAAVERRLEEKRARISQIERERNERERELAEEKDELSRLKAQLSAHESSKNATLQKAFDVIDGINEEQLDETNPAIQTHAKKVGMSPEQLLHEYEEQRDEQ